MQNTIGWVLVLGMFGCGLSDDTFAQVAQVEPDVVELAPPGVVDSTSRGVWAHDPELELLARDAVTRLSAATGLRVDVNKEGRMPFSAPMFWSSSLPGAGMTFTAPLSGWVAIAQGGDSSDVLRQLVHTMGIGSLEVGTVGLMQLGEAGSEKLTSADLELICAEKPCTAFVPE